MINLLGLYSGKTLETYRGRSSQVIPQ